MLIINSHLFNYFKLVLLGLMKFMVEYQIKWGQLDGENGALGYPISDEHILMEIIKATLKKVI